MQLSSGAAQMPSNDRWEANVLPTDSTQPTVPILVLEEDAYDDWLKAQPQERQDWMAASGFSKFKDGGLTLLPSSADPTWAFMTSDAASLHAFSALPAKLPSEKCYRLEAADGSSQPLPPTAGISWGLGCYSFDACKGEAARAKREEEPPFAQLVMPIECDAAATGRTLSATFLCRDLINAPASHMGPAELEAAARRLGDSSGATVSTVEGEALREGYPQIHAVGRAAAAGRQPRLIDMRWGAPDAPRVTLVGKGVCFDTGGLDIKPPAAMLTMKKDMGGAAHVLGLASMIMGSKAAVNLRVLIAAVENSIAGDAFRPGDVLVARNGKTTEIGNTDAEGRLVLADALVEACAERPELLIDCATLTGAGRVALGTDVPALFCNDQGAAVADELVALSADEQDQVWRLPLWQGYREQIDSKVADLKNIGSGPYGGAITAALYLAEFVEAPPPPSDGEGKEEDDEGGAAPPAWLHLDMMAYNTGAKPGRPEGGEAMGMRALAALVATRFGTSS